MLNLEQKIRLYLMARDMKPTANDVDAEDYNPHHGEHGRFSEAEGSLKYVPNKALREKNERIARSAGGHGKALSQGIKKIKEGKAKRERVMRKAGGHGKALSQGIKKGSK